MFLLVVFLFCVTVKSSDCICICFFKQKTAYEMRISDWSSDVCSSDLGCGRDQADALSRGQAIGGHTRADRRGRGGQVGDGRGGDQGALRSEERRVGKEWGRTCRSRWSPYH